MRELEEALSSPVAGLIVTYIGLILYAVIAVSLGAIAWEVRAWRADKRKRRERIRGLVYAAERRAHLNGDRPALNSPPPSKGHA